MKIKSCWAYVFPLIELKGRFLKISKPLLSCRVGWFRIFSPCKLKIDILHNKLKENTKRTSQLAYDGRIAEIITRLVSVQQAPSRGRNYRLSSLSSQTRSSNWIFKRFDRAGNRIAVLLSAGHKTGSVPTTVKPFWRPYLFSFSISSEN